MEACPCRVDERVCNSLWAFVKELVKEFTSRKKTRELGIEAIVAVALSTDSDTTMLQVKQVGSEGGKVVWEVVQPIYEKVPA